MKGCLRTLRNVLAVLLVIAVFGTLVIAVFGTSSDCSTVGPSNPSLEPTTVPEVVVEPVALAPTITPVVQVGQTIVISGAIDPISQPSTPEPTSTPEPMLSCDKGGLSYRSSMTEMQWAAYERSLVGEPIAFYEKVSGVSKDGSVFIGHCAWHVSGGILYGIASAEAIELYKGVMIQGRGTIHHVRVATLGGLQVYIDVEDWRTGY